MGPTAFRRSSERPDSPISADMAAPVLAYWATLGHQVNEHGGTPLEEAAALLPRTSRTKLVATMPHPRARGLTRIGPLRTSR